MIRDQILQQIGLGAAAGLVGTAAMEAARTANEKFSARYERFVPDRDEVETVRAVREPQSWSDNLRTASSTLLSLGYGSTAAAFYSALRQEPTVLLDGAALGAVVWGAGYLGWLPGLPTVRRNRSKGQIAMSLAQHVLFGVATVGAFRRLKRAVD